MCQTSASSCWEKGGSGQGMRMVLIGRTPGHQALLTLMASVIPAWDCGQLVITCPWFSYPLLPWQLFYDHLIIIANNCLVLIVFQTLCQVTYMCHLKSSFQHSSEISITIEQVGQQQVRCMEKCKRLAIMKRDFFLRLLPPPLTCDRGGMN